MKRTMLTGVALLALVVGACTGGSTAAPSASLTLLGGGPSPAPSSAPSVPGSTAPSPAPSSAPSLEPTGKPTSLDPCDLVTSGDASALSGATYGDGVASTTPGGGKVCTYGANTTNVFTVIVGVAGSAAIAKAGEAQAEAGIVQLAAQGLKFTKVKSFAPGADAAYFVGPLQGGINAAAIYVLAGPTLFGFSDLVQGGPAPKLADIEARANAMLGRIP